MTLGEAIRKALSEGDYVLACGVSDFCRLRLGLDYRETFEVVRRAAPKATPAEWEALLYEGDCESELTQR